MLKDFRQSAGLSQYQVAKLLGVPRSVINMAEREERQLPRAANRRLMEIYLAMESLKGAVPAHETLPEVKQYVAGKLHRKAELLRAKAQVMQYKIEDFEAKYKTWDQLLLLVSALEKLHGAVQPAEYEKAWQELEKSKHRNARKDKQLLQLKMMRVKMISMEAEAAEMEKLAAEIEKEI